MHCTAVAPAIDQDDTVFVASAWNDNGFYGKVGMAAMRDVSYHLVSIGLSALRATLF